MTFPFKLCGITLALTIALSTFNKSVALESNEKESPQKLSDTFQSLCLNRSSDCEVELDVPTSCINAEGKSTCPVVFFLHGSGGTNDWFFRTSGVHDYNMIGVYPNGDCRGWNTGMYFQLSNILAEVEFYRPKGL